LDETYARILDNIDEDYRRDALKILQWLTYSARPLRLEEVAEVIAIDFEESPRFNPEKRYPEPRDIWTICSSLISLEEEALEDTHEGNTRVNVRLAHFSVKEYLISPSIRNGQVEYYSIQEVETNALIAQSCLVYLLQFDEPGSLTTRSVLEFPLANYAAEYWTKHAQVAERDSTLAHVLSIELLLTRGHGLLNWIRLYSLDQPSQGSDMMRGLNDVHPPLYYASFAGLIGSVKSILDKGAYANAQGGLYGNALQAASGRGHDQVVQILLAKGADINAQGGYHSNALQAASAGGHSQIVQMLLAKGADVNANAQGGYHGNALQAASAGGHDQVVQILLAKGADVNAQGGLYGNTLQAASAEGYDQIVQTLLAQGAEVNAQGGEYGNVLQAASAGGHDQVVQILLAKGAEVNAQGGEYGNALQAASYQGHNQLVQILLAKGADVNAQGGEYGSALHAASAGGHDQVVQMLLANGADVRRL